MKTRKFKFYHRSRGVSAAAAAAIFLWGMFYPVYGQEKAADTRNEPIRITSDKLVADNENRTAQFTGNVRAVQGTTVITTDRLTLFFDGRNAKPAAGEKAQDIERIEAHGNVRIEFDNNVAVSKQAVYIVSERKLVLTGPDSKVVSGRDEIIGSKITFYRNDGRVALEGDDQNKVKAIIHSDQRGLN